MPQHPSHPPLNQPKTERQNESLTVNAATAESLDINGQNAENASGKKQTTKRPTKTCNNQPNLPTIRKSSPSTIPNWCAKSVAKWDIPPETAHA